MTPEERARQQIDLILKQSGWIVQDRSQTNLTAGPGVAIREALLKGGEADYLLFAGGKAIATVEAKPEGYTLTGVEGQSDYASQRLRWWRGIKARTHKPTSSIDIHRLYVAPFLRWLDLPGLWKHVVDPP